MNTEWKNRAFDLLLRNCTAAFAGLALIKIVAVGYNIFASDVRGYEPAYTLAPKLLLFIGSDVFGAVLFGVVVTGVCLPVLRRSRLPAVLCIVLQAIHGLLATVSFFSVVHLGGPLNKSALDLLFLDRTTADDLGLSALAGSLADYCTAVNIGFLILVQLAVMAGFLSAPRLFRRCSVVGLRIAGIVSAVASLFTIAVLPFLMSGEVGGIRIATYGLEKSVLVELGWSYLKTVQKKWQIDQGLITDEFRFQFEGHTPPGSTTPPLHHAVPQRTNLLVVAMESVGAPYLEGERTPMPFLRQLGGRPGAHVFDNTYSTWSLTSKAFFSVLCSELPYPTYKAESFVNASIPCVSLPEALNRAGYHTALITSQSLAYDRLMNFYRHRNFDLIWDMRNMPDVDRSWTSSWGMDDRVVAAKVLEQIAERRADPFFIFYGMAAGHHPFNCCAEHEENPIADREQRYYRALGFVDRRLEQLITGLEKIGELERTLVVIFSDHGDGHGRYVGRNVWQPVIKVPLLVLGPQLGSIPGRSTMVTSLIDIAPTVLGLLNIAVPCTMKGRNLAVDNDHRIALFGGRPPKWQLGVADDHWKFIWEDKQIEMLFDLARDPAETDNLAQHHPDRVSFYKRKLDQWSAFSTNLIENYADILSQHPCRTAGVRRK